MKRRRRVVTGVGDKESSGSCGDSASEGDAGNGESTYCGDGDSPDESTDYVTTA